MFPPVFIKSGKAPGRTDVLRSVPKNTYSSALRITSVIQTGLSRTGHRNLKQITTTSFPILFNYILFG
jgi:hypothetical protein